MEEAAGDVVALEVHQRGPVPEVVELLEAFLAKARDGELRAVGVIALGVLEGIDYSRWAEGDEVPYSRQRLVYGTQALAHMVTTVTMIEAHEADNDDDDDGG